MEIAGKRLHAQQLVVTSFNTPGDLVSWMGAMQAQDLPMVKWAIGLRQPGSTIQTIEAALDAGEILRTHVLRPTWHLVRAEDLVWMIRLTCDKIRSSTAARSRQLGLTPHLLLKYNDLLCRALEEHGAMSRDEISLLLQRSGIHNDDNRYAHILMNAELDALICSGAGKQGKTTYDLVSRRILSPRILDKEQSLAELAQRYFQSHGPATLDDFVWWSGLGKKDAMKGLELFRHENSHEIVATRIDGVSYWMHARLSRPDPQGEEVILLPAFDEFIISYRNREAVIPADLQKRAISSNGIFWPVVLFRGKAIGTWSRVSSKNRLKISFNLFYPSTEDILLGIREQAKAYALFMGSGIELTIENAG